MVVCVGATAVGAICTSYDTASAANPAQVAKGDQLAIFNLGSTVILLLEKSQIHLRSLCLGDKIRMGQVVGWRSVACDVV